MAVNCGWCGTDEYVDYDEASNVALCSGPGHPVERMWEPPKNQGQRPNTPYEGFAHELGLYDDLPECLNEGEWADTAVVEYHYARAHPDTYRFMLDRWGHVAMGPRRYSVTSFIGSTLGHLSRLTNVTYKPGPGSGFFAYNRRIGYWTLEPVPDETVDLAYADLAAAEGFDPMTWPLLGDG